MQSSLVLTALVMGLAGGPHCVAMCGAACAGLGHAAGTQSIPVLLRFQFGRVLGYAALGALAAASMQGLGWMTTQTAALRPVWTMFHVAALLIGLLLLWRAQQPIWMEDLARRLWARVRRLATGHGWWGPLALGMAWAFLPCGLLYSALLVAALAANAWQGGAVMAAFAAGTAVSMSLGPWLWLRLRGAGHGDWGVRLAGLALSGSAAWALWMAYANNQAPWCTTS